MAVHSSAQQLKSERVPALRPVESYHAYLWRFLFDQNDRHGIVTSLCWQIDKCLGLDDSGVEMRFRRWTRDVVQQANQHFTRFVRLNDSVHPAARGAVTYVGLLFVTLFHLRASSSSSSGVAFLSPRSRAPWRESRTLCLDACAAPITA